MTYFDKHNLNSSSRGTKRSHYQRTMSNIKTIQSLYDFFQSRELDKIRKIFHADIKWNQMKGFPNGGEYVGAEEIFANVFKGFSENWTDWKADVSEYLEAGDDIIAVGQYKGTFNKSGKYVEADFMHRYTLKDGLIIQFKQYTDTGAFFAAMRGGKDQKQENNPLHGVKLTVILDYLLEEYGWYGLAARVDINCFKSNPTVKSSLNFLRKFDWARKEVEELYLRTLEENAQENI